MTVIVIKRLDDTLQIGYIKQFVFTIMISLYVFNITLFYIFHSVLPSVFFCIFLSSIYHMYRFNFLNLFLGASLFYSKEAQSPRQLHFYKASYIVSVFFLVRVVHISAHIKAFCNQVIVVVVTLTLVQYFSSLE